MMKRKFLSAALAMSMLASQLPATAFAQEAAMEEEELIAALAQAQAGDTVELTGSVELTSQLVIEKEIVLDGNGFTISKGESEDVFPNNAGILVTAGATLRDLNVEGPNTNPGGWDGGEFAIKFYEAQGALLQNVVVGQANAGIQVNGGSVTMSGSITVSDNEFGGIEVCREGRLDLTQAVLVNESETKEVPTLWNDSGKGTILAGEDQPLYIWEEYASGKDHLYLNQANLGVEAQVGAVNYETLAQALEAAGESEEDKTVVLLKDVSVGRGEQAQSGSSGAALTLPEGVTLDGGGHRVSYDGQTEIGSLLQLDGADSAIRDIVFSDNGKARHVLALSQADNARLEKVTVQGGQTAAILVNGAWVTLENSVLAPLEGARASIAYQADSRLPSLELNNVQADSKASLLYVSRETLEQVGALSSTEDMDEILKQVRASIGGTDRVELTYDEESGSVSAPALAYYAVTLEASENGELTADLERAQPGTVVTLTVKPHEGYQLEKLEALDSQTQAVELTYDEESGAYRFQMPEGSVTVRAVFGRAGEGSPFQDVTQDDWFFQAVNYVYQNGIMSGVEEGRFAPDITLTRAMLTQTLYAMEGKPQAEREEHFTDVAQGDWYAAAVAWAAENGLVSGVGGTRFAPNDALTREQMALILYRYAQYKHHELQTDGDPLEHFQDAEQVSSWAQEAMAWAVATGLLSGTGDETLSPAGTATRAQVAQVLFQFCQSQA